jgi:hypothetical protein
MTKLTLEQVRDHFHSEVTVMGGVPSVCLLRDSMPDAEFEVYIEDFMSQLGGGDHLILGVSDTTPPGADFERIKRIGEQVRAFGPVQEAAPA